MVGSLKGYIALHRKIFDQEFFNRDRKPFSKREAFIWLCCMANHKDNELVFEGELILIKRGELITSQKKLCRVFKWGNTAIRNYLKHLQLMQMIDYKTNSKATRITICNYTAYQDSQHNNNTLPTRKQHTTNTPATTNNNVKNGKNVKNVNKINSISDLKSVVFTESNIDTYGVDMLTEFVEYWGEMPLNGGKMLCLKEKGFHIGRRLSKWGSNDYSGHWRLHRERRIEAKKTAERDAIIKQAEKENQLDPEGFEKLKKGLVDKITKRA